ncbi:MAG: DUF6491 family protein, partial [Phenylobacterium sp.]
MKTSPLLLSAVLFAGCAGPEPGRDGPAAASAPRQCFRPQDINNFRAADDRTVYLRVGVNDIYRLDLIGPCPE